MGQFGLQIMWQSGSYFAANQHTPMAPQSQATAAFTITTLGPAISRTLEPHAAAPARRLRAIRTRAETGIPVGISIAPIIPFVTEPEIKCMRGDGVWADLIRQRFHKTVDRIGMIEIRATLAMRRTACVTQPPWPRALL